jgi:hypothetical protein
MILWTLRRSEDFIGLVDFFRTMDAQYISPLRAGGFD